MEERSRFRRSGSPSVTRTHFRPRFIKTESFSRTSSTSLRSQRYHTAEGTSFHPRRPPTGLYLRPPASQCDDVENFSKCLPGTSKGYKDAPGSVHRTGRERDIRSLSVMISEEREIASSRGLPSSVTRVAARNLAIQQKRREIEEVYKQDCDTVGIVVKMLISKDPSLEQLIQASLQENLREIGLRCVEAMERFIQDYDSQ
ncbi:hypothetical protein SKAU_G00097620 [Synaphobranchus kaupii]|uniref:Periphilin-1 C-terminal domain-containing protein n=1 Tax=Synaphobranchus kaupii TaxID=118154 RepID=A0A9Q1FYI2_SYNKA|nr:hypothetical protein SKAU_G00097620 [Synaphobranchus kaupii]